MGLIADADSGSTNDPYRYRTVYPAGHADVPPTSDPAYIRG